MLLIPANCQGLPALGKRIKELIIGGYSDNFVIKPIRLICPVKTAKNNPATAILLRQHELIVHGETLWMGDTPKRDPRLSQYPLNLHRNPSQGWLGKDFYGCTPVSKSYYGFDNGCAFHVRSSNAYPRFRSEPGEKLQDGVRPHPRPEMDFSVFPSRRPVCGWGKTIEHDTFRPVDPPGMISQTFNKRGVAKPNQDIVTMILVTDFSY